MSEPQSTAPEGHKPEVSIPDGAVLMSTGITQPLKMVPEDKLYDLVGKYEQVIVQIRRRNNKGQLASLGYNGVPMSPSDVLAIEAFIEPRCGGGTYSIDVRDPRDTRLRLVPTYELIIEGAPRMPVPAHMPVAHAAGGYTGSTFGGNAPASFQNPEADARQNMVSPWAQGLDPATQALYQHSARMQMGGGGLPNGATMPSDQIERDRASRAEARVAELEAKFEALMSRSSERERHFQEQLRTEQEKAREERHKMEMTLLQEQIRAATAARPTTNTMQEMVPLLTALAPVMTAMVSSGKEQQTAMMTSQQAAMQQFMGLVAEQNKKPQVDPFTVIEKLGPLLMGGKQDPTAQAALFEAMSNAQLQQVAMLAQMVEAQNQAAGGASPYGPLMETVVGGLGEMVRGYMADKQRAAMEQAAIRARMLGSGQPQPQQPQRPQQQAPVQAQAPQTATVIDVPSTGYTTISDAGVAPQLQTGKLKVTPEMLALLPAEFQTNEWKRIIVELHDESDPQKLGTLIARYIGHLDEFDMLPAVLADYHLNPIETLGKLLLPLPIYASNPNYAQTITQATVRAMFETGVLQTADDGEDGPDDEDAAPGDNVVEQSNVVPFPTPTAS